MKKTVTLFLILFSSFYVLAQDLIIRTNGENIECKVTSVDSTNVYFSLYKNDEKTNSFIKKTEVKEIKYNELETNDYKVITIGILEGGGSLIGMDAEIILHKNFGFQVGAGFFGFGGGLNIHFKPAPRSSFVSLQYWHQGFSDSYTQSLLGPCYVYRGRKWFTAQIGLGFPLEKGPKFPENTVQPPVMLTYAIGIYFL
jgi:hypothetical protein